MEWNDNEEVEKASLLQTGYKKFRTKKFEKCNSKVIFLVYIVITCVFCLASTVFFICNLVFSYKNSGLRPNSTLPSVWICLFSFFFQFLLLLTKYVVVNCKKSSKRVLVAITYFDFNYSLFVFIVGICSSVCYFITRAIDVGVTILILWVFFSFFSIIFFIWFKYTGAPTHKEFLKRKTKKKKCVYLLKFLGFFGKLFLALLILLVSLLLVMFLYQAFGLSNDHFLFKPEGIFVEVDARSSHSFAYSKNSTYGQSDKSWRIHIHCTGERSDIYPPILLELTVFIGGSSAVGWWAVQEILSNFTRVCSYDRAGYGFSESGLKPRTIAQQIGEVAQLLEKTGEAEAGPFLIVGHSVGGTLARFFAYKYPHRVAGLVLVDATPDEYDRKYPVKNVNTVLDLCRTAAVFGGFRLGIRANDFHPPEKRREQAATYHLNENWDSQYWDVMSMSYDYDAVAHAKVDCPAREYCLGNLPMLYVKAGNNVWNKTCEELHYPLQSKECKDQLRMNRDWQEFIQDFSRMTHKFQFDVCMDCFHNMIWARPKLTAELVLDFMREIV